MASHPRVQGFMMVDDMNNKNPRNKSKSPRPDRRNLHVTIKEKRKRLKKPNGSESEGSDDSTSVSSLADGATSARSSPAKSLKDKKASGEWEIVEGLREGQRCDDKPLKLDGFMLKKRKWPMKGWHKRYFVLDKGLLQYAKTPSDIQKGKVHGEIDIGLSVLSFKRGEKRLDIDAEDLIYHLKVKSRDLFESWITHLKHHRLYRQHEIAFGSRDAPKLTDVSTPVEDLTPQLGSPLSPLTPLSPLSPVQALPLNKLSPLSEPMKRTFSLSRERNASIKSRGGSLAGQGKVAAWLLDTNGIDKCNKDLTTAQAKIFELSQILEKLQTLSANIVAQEETVLEIRELDPANIKKDKSSKIRISLRKGLRREKKSSTPSLNLMDSGPRLSISGAIPLTNNEHDRMHLSSSNPNLSAQPIETLDRPLSFPQGDGTSPNISLAENRLQEAKMREEFLDNSKQVHSTLKSLTRTISTERERLKHAVEQETVGSMQANVSYIHSLRLALTETVRQNAEYKSRLTKIHEMTGTTFSDPSPTLEKVPHSPILTQAPSADYAAPSSAHAHSLLAQSLSAESASTCEFFDAAEYIASSNASSEASDDESSDVSEENDTECTPRESSADDSAPTHQSTGRRSKLPSPKSDAGDISLWNLLCKNIGKDLTKISMPVTLNEPLSTLQRLCEELEYSELLDKAAEMGDPYERMVLVAAFAVSGYASSYYRAGQKPFNPLLGETYEAIREDRGWRFIAEQVSHHPPISTCYCESKNFVFWQDARIKTKFWGKSMEIQPVGTVNLFLPKYKEHYKWNKVTTCVHNLLGGQRWVDQYGEMIIRNGDILCKLTFTKSSYWSEKRHEVYGHITNPEGKVVHHIFGKWNEGLYHGQSSSAKCIWRPGAMPEDYDIYYGFTRFAMELNEIDQVTAPLLPSTDTRFRPDQRYLEEGRVQDAENEKLRIEQLQRDRRKTRENEGISYDPRWFQKTMTDDGKEFFEYKQNYWTLRKDPGFANLSITSLW